MCDLLVAVVGAIACSLGLLSLCPTDAIGVAGAVNGYNANPPRWELTLGIQLYLIFSIVVFAVCNVHRMTFLEKVYS